MATSKSKSSRSGGSSSGTGSRTHSAGTGAGSAKAKAKSSRSHTERITTDHDEIRRWAEERGAHPACVKGTRQGDSCLLRLDFPGYTGEESLEPISWDQFFRVFDKNELAVVYDETTASGERSNFNKLIKREDAE